MSDASVSENARQTANRRRKSRLLLAAAFIVVLVSALLVLLRLVTLRGIVFPVRVTSASMAPALFGTHRAIECRDCGFDVTFAEEYPPPDGLATCPNCGCRENDADLAQRRLGDRVTIDSLGPRLRALERFEMVAFREAALGEQLAVKRIAALPGEELTIRNGELYANGALVRKNRRQQLSMRVLVHDDRFRSNDERANARWRPEAPSSRWQAVDNGYAISGSAAIQSKDRPIRFDWLIYRHFPCHPSPVGRLTESPVTDLDTFNQGLPRSNVRPTADVALEMRWRSSGEGAVALAVTDGGDRFLLTIDLSKARWELDRNRVRLASAALPANLLAKLSSEAVVVEFGLCDRQLCFALGGRTLARVPYRKRTKGKLSSRPLMIGACGGSHSLTDLRVYRDVHYAGPGDKRKWRPAANDGESRGDLRTYLVLGDNPPASVDSRHRVEGVPFSIIEGIVKKLE
jgi:signal peptidase I